MFIYYIIFIILYYIKMFDIIIYYSRVRNYDHIFREMIINYLKTKERRIHLLLCLISFIWIVMTKAFFKNHFINKKALK
jgi:hypothetical protein